MEKYAVVWFENLWPNAEVVEASGAPDAVRKIVRDRSVIGDMTFYTAELSSMRKHEVTINVQVSVENKEE